VVSGTVDILANSAYATDITLDNLEGLPDLTGGIGCFVGHWSCAARDNITGGGAGLANVGNVIDVQVLSPTSLKLTIQNAWNASVLLDGANYPLLPLYFEVKVLLL
jgi:hypothetical protein